MGQAKGNGAARRLTGVSVAACCAMLLAAQWAVGADHGGVRPSQGAPAARPRVSGNLLVPVRRQLALAFGLAQFDIRTNPACSALFGRFEKDGLELLARVEFGGGTIEMAGGTCDRGGVAAFTKVKSRRIMLCPGFAVLEVPAAAVILIHEALHTAGLGEKPSDPNGLTPQEINRMVAGSCNR